MILRRRSTIPLLPAALVAALAATACTSDAAGPDADPRGPGFTGGKVDDLFADGPMYLTGAFDGSKSIRMWLDTMGFARELSDETGKELRWTYFINTAYYSTTVQGSEIGRAASKNDALIRWAITQQAINEGHEIANHTVRHHNGQTWSNAQWKAEIDEFHADTERHLFNTVVVDGEPAFPRWAPAAAADPGEVGAACDAAGDCDSGSCRQVTPDLGLCSASCESDADCANGTVCAGICLPKPQAPVLDEDGGTLIDADGSPNLANPNMVPYRIVGFRGPQLGHNPNLYEELTARGYTYDTSFILPPGPPLKTLDQGTSFNLFQFALMRHPNTGAIPMDYNYYFNDISADRMTSDYKKSIVRSYNELGRVPWNIGHHFSLWKDGGYWAAMKTAFRYAADGCVEGGVKKCADVEFIRFRDLAAKLDGNFDNAGDLFANPGILEVDDETFAGEACEDHE
jgi:hypothetical protein